MVAAMTLKLRPEVLSFAEALERDLRKIERADAAFHKAHGTTPSCKPTLYKRDVAIKHSSAVGQWFGEQKRAMDTITSGSM